MMTSLLSKAFEQASGLPEMIQDEIAEDLLDKLACKTGRNRIPAKLPEDVYRKLGLLNKGQVLQVLNFMEFLKDTEAKDSFSDFIASEADPDVTLEQVREELSSIRGNLSDVIISEREDRI